MYWKHDTHDIYDTLPMQAALHLYLPHVVQACELPHREFSSHHPDKTHPFPAVRKRKRTQNLW
ncbi:hypothetical protein ACTQ34_13895 [Agathobaculum sp. LCP25S3_E8]|uniref:hypothetical protein n=1 Tax=Agathobaculum sp. LCP25S3_E8 TaxID=3438735 RepID=UPI003F921D54